MKMDYSFIKFDPECDVQGHMITDDEDDANISVKTNTNKFPFDKRSNDTIGTNHEITNNALNIKTEEVIIKDDVENDDEVISSKNVIICKVCLKRTSKKSIERHMKMHKYNYKCEHCYEYFMDGLECILHMNVHTDKYDCIYCHYFTEIKDEIVSHVNVHIQSKYKMKDKGTVNVTQLTCPVCSKQCASKAILRRHMKNHGEKKCDICKKYIIVADMTNHICYQKFKTSFTCTLCSKIFAKPSVLKIHMRYHTGEKPFQCNVCDKKFFVRPSLIAHIRTHTGERPFQCKECDKKFTTKHELTIHTRSHTGEKPFQCNVCDKKYSQSHSLRTHMRTHTGEKPFQCYECDKKFTSKQKLKFHTRIHTGEKPFQCYECDKKFSLKENLVAHTRYHTGDKPFECYNCDKSFYTKHRLVAHMAIHTKQIFKCNMSLKNEQS